MRFVALVPSRDAVTLFGHPSHVAPDFVFISPMTWNAIVSWTNGFRF
jgi:hypothetical protein